MNFLNVVSNILMNLSRFYWWVWKKIAQGFAYQKRTTFGFWENANNDTGSVHKTLLLSVTEIFLIGIHSMQGWAATARHGVTRKRSKKKEEIKAYRKSLLQEPTVNRCLLILDLQPYRS